MRIDSLWDQPLTEGPTSFAGFVNILKSKVFLTEEVLFDLRSDFVWHLLRVKVDNIGDEVRCHDSLERLGFVSIVLILQIHCKWTYLKRKNFTGRIKNERLFFKVKKTETESERRN